MVTTVHRRDTAAREVVVRYRDRAVHMAAGHRRVARLVVVRSTLQEKDSWRVYQLIGGARYHLHSHHLM